MLYACLFNLVNQVTHAQPLGKRNYFEKKKGPRSAIMLDKGASTVILFWWQVTDEAQMEQRWRIHNPFMTCHVGNLL